MIGADEDDFFGGAVALVTFGNGVLGRLPEPGSGRLGGKGEDEFRILRGAGRGNVKEAVYKSMMLGYDSEGSAVLGKSDAGIWVYKVSRGKANHRT